LSAAQHWARRHEQNFNRFVAAEVKRQLLGVALWQAADVSSVETSSCPRRAHGNIRAGGKLVDRASTRVFRSLD